jgi:hypothetical protein
MVPKRDVLHIRKITVLNVTLAKLRQNIFIIKKVCLKTSCPRVGAKVKKKKVGTLFALRPSTVGKNIFKGRFAHEPMLLAILL